MIQQRPSRDVIRGGKKRDDKPRQREQTRFGWDGGLEYETPVVRKRVAEADIKAPPLPEIDGERDIYPLMAPGITMPGPDFIDLAERLGDQGTEITGKGKNKKLESVGEILLEAYKRALYSAGTFSIRTSIKNRKVVLRVVTGHRWGGEVTGPVKSDVMILSKMLGEEEVANCRNLVGPSGELLHEMASKYTDDSAIGEWYVTNLLKTSHPEGYGNSVLKQSWIKEWLPILDQELRIVRPKIIICVGADASKALLGKHASVTWMAGRVIEHTYPISRSTSGDIKYHTALVMTVLHPAAVLKAPEQEDKLDNGIARAVQLINGQRWDKEEEGLDHRLVDNLDDLRDLQQEVDADIEQNLLGIDAEWHGQHPQNKGAYLRSVQVSWRHKTATSILLRRQHGKRIYSSEEMEEVRQLIRKICKGKILVGHFFDADMEFMTAFGIDLREQYRVPDTWQQYMEAVLGGKPCGFDTGLAAHALNETDDFSLTSQALRYTTAPRYDMALIECKKAYCKEHGLKDKELEGFGPFSDEVLFGHRQSDGQMKHSYGCYDADVARRLAVKRIRQLCKDGFGNNCWEPMWRSMRAVPVILEINTTGVMLDRARIDEMTETYMSARAELGQEIREWARWPEFNLNSVFHIREFLFGEQYNGNVKGTFDDPYRLRPPKARSLKLDPLFTTDKRPVPWEEVRNKDQEDEKTASTDKTTLPILARENQAVERWQKKQNKFVVFDFSKQVNWIRDYRFISQVLKSSLRPPILDDDDEGETAIFRKDANGFYVYAGGLAASLCDDERIRTHIYPTLETRRWASARPPLMNLSKKRESDYKRILKKQYKWALRSIIKSSPGKVLVEADLIGAELFGMAIMSGDERMIEHAKRNQLAEDHPEFYDIHSNVAKLAFGFKCAATKAGLDSLGMSHMRIVAKAVIFGIAYGRGAKAIALQAKEEGVEITVDEAKQIIDTIFQMYPDLEPFFAECAQRAIKQRWMCGCFGGFRRFQSSRGNRQTQGEFERQAMNFPIQGMIADAMSQAADNFDTYRRGLESDDDFWFSIVLQIHDAFLFEVEHQHVERLVDDVIPLCMTDQVPIYPCYLDGMPKVDPNAPYYFGVDTEVGDHWGELMYPDEFKVRGIHPKYGGWTKTRQGWRHINKHAGEVWRKDGGWVKLVA